jgi:aspartate carbamoyltransferase catalytic subunit
MSAAAAGKNIKICLSLDDVIKKLDVIMALRIQMERHLPASQPSASPRGEQAGRGSFFPSAREYRQFFGVTMDRLNQAKKDIIVMHPGPINRGIEMDPEVADSKHSVILEQVTNGVAVRMAILYALLGGKKE